VNKTNANKPNVIMIVADDMGYGDFGRFGDGSSKTPALDRFSEEGIVLTQHYSAAPVCTPARAGLLTGRYPHRTGAIDMRELRGLNRLSLQERTIGDLFKKGGYTTGLIGKWHLGTIGPEYHPNSRGFDEFIGFRGGGSDYYKWRLYYNRDMKEADGRYLTDVFTEEAIGFIRRHQAAPFFLHLAYNAPHAPHQAPEEEVQEFAQTGKFTTAVSTIYAMIRRMDQGIGRILEQLKQLGLEDDTIVLFVSDNGPQFGGRGDSSSDRYNCDLRGSKGKVYDGGIRVPGIIRWPAGLKGGGTNDGFIHFTDWLPTLLAAAGVDVPEGLELDGHNVMPLLRGEADAGCDKRFWQWNRYTPLVTCNAAMRDGIWKLVRPDIKEAMWADPEEMSRDREVEHNPELFTDIVRIPEPDRVVPPPGPAQLFNLQEDPRETTDLADRYPDIAARMQLELEEWFASVEADRKLGQEQHKHTM
jgi:arylsulfatase A